jgi:hypothetical protein
VTQRQTQFLKDETKLFQGTQSTRNEKGRLDTSADYGEVENPRVGREERAPLAPRPLDQVVIEDAVLP